MVNEAVRLAPHADLLSPARALTEDERVILAREADSFYRAFVEVVAAGRARPYEEVEPLARGRVWAGEAAHREGLVDQLGGLEEAAKLALSQLDKAIEAPLRAARAPRQGRLEALKSPAQTPLEAWLTRVPELAELDALTSDGGRALYYALGLPQIQ